MTHNQLPQIKRSEKHDSSDPKKFLYGYKEDA